MSVRLVLVVVAIRLAVGTACAADPPLQAVARDLVGPDQGLYVQAEDGTVLAAVEADRPVHPASVTKVATTLVLLERLGPTYRFETRLFATGPIGDGVVQGDLLVQAGGDPFLVTENVLVVLLDLHDRGIRRIENGLAVQGRLFFNWQPDPRGVALRRVLEGRDGAGAWPAVRSARADATGLGSREVGLRFAGAHAATAGHVPQLLAVHRSPPLIRVVKALNCYSNNVFHLASERIGGPAVVERQARERVPPALRSAIVIDNAAGAGTTNRLSPRAAVALLDALADELRRNHLSLVDALPVAGIDPGTLHERLPRGVVVGKTGTFGSVGASALVGVLRTQRWGQVTFAILNRGVAVPEARRRQDAFVRALIDAGVATPWPYESTPLPTFTEAKVDAIE